MVLTQIKTDSLNGANPLDSLGVFLKDHILKKLILKKVSRRQKKHEKLPSMQRAKAYNGGRDPKLCLILFHISIKGPDRPQILIPGVLHIHIYQPCHEKLI